MCFVDCPIEHDGQEMILDNVHEVLIDVIHLLEKEMVYC
jgi:hypothetical protein